MTNPTRSYLKVPYDLRLSKQIERRMIIDALQRMAEGGFRIRQYQYTGMGSIFYVDFILFHRYLGIRRMVNVEFSREITRRVKFNQPFRNIDLQFGNIGDVIPTLDPDLQHILWLDYDDVLSPDVVTDAANAATVLSPGSVLLITVDITPPTAGKPRDWRQYFFRNFKSYYNPTWSTRDFAQSNLARVNMEILDAAIKQGIVGRSVSFFPLFNFVYADGREMLTAGGMIGTESERSDLDGCDFSDAIYIRRDLRREPYRIRKITVTRKEKIYLDSQMPAKRGWQPGGFEITTEDLRAYSETYRFFPTYAELLV